MCLQGHASLLMGCFAAGSDAEPWAWGVERAVATGKTDPLYRACRLVAMHEKKLLSTLLKACVSLHWQVTSANHNSFPLTIFTCRTLRLRPVKAMMITVPTMMMAARITMIAVELAHRNHRLGCSSQNSAADRYTQGLIR
jgi:hypothetical protein